MGMMALGGRAERWHFMAKAKVGVIIVMHRQQGSDSQGP